MLNLNSCPAYTYKFRPLFAKYQALFFSAKFRLVGEFLPTISPFSHHLNREFQTRAACRLLKSFARFPLCFLLCIFHSHKQRELVPEHLILPDELPPPPSAYKGHNSLVCSKFNPAFLIRSPAARGTAPRAPRGAFPAVVRACRALLIAAFDGHNPQPHIRTEDRTPHICGPNGSDV